MEISPGLHIAPVASAVVIGLSFAQLESGNGMQRLVNDLLARHVAGILPQGESGVIVDPLPFGERVELSGVRLAGHEVSVRVADGAYAVRIDGRSAGKGKIGRALELHW